MAVVAEEVAVKIPGQCPAYTEHLDHEKMGTTSQLNDGQIIGYICGEKMYGTAELHVGWGRMALCHCMIEGVCCNFSFLIILSEHGTL